MGKKFSCKYLRKDGTTVGNSIRQVLAEDPEDAAKIFAAKYPKPYPSINVSGGVLSKNHSFDHREGMMKALEKKDAAQKQREAQKLSKKEAKRAKEEAIEQQRLESLERLEVSIKSADGDLSRLSYDNLVVLIGNLRDFPRVRNKLSAQECAVREELYKVAFFDSNLQIGVQAHQSVLQVKLLRDLKSILTGKQPGKSGKRGGKSNLAQNAALLGGAAALHKLNQIEENTGDVSEGFGFD